MALRGTENLSALEPCEQALEVGREVPGFPGQAEECRSLAGPEKQISQKQFEHHGKRGTVRGLGEYGQVYTIPNKNAALVQDRVRLVKALKTEWIEHCVDPTELAHS